MRSLRVTFLAFLAVILPFVAGCRPAVMVVPPHIHNIGVSTFENRTPDFGLETLLTNETIRQFQMDGRMPLTDPDRADLQLKVVIRQYLEEPIQYDTATNYVLQYRLTVTYDLVAFDRKEGKPLVEEKSKARSVFYYTSYYTNAVTETEEQARQRLAEEVGRSTVRKVLEGF
jgi:hypothetical protein